MARTRRRASSSRDSGWLVVEPVDHALVEDVDRELARDLAGRGAAHAVAHREERARACRRRRCGCASSRPRVLRDRSATRKLSSLCSRTCPTSVRAKSLRRISPAGRWRARSAPSSRRAPRRASRGVGLGHVSNRKSCWPMRKWSPVPQAHFLAHLQEGPVRRSEVGQGEAAVSAHCPAPCRQRGGPRAGGRGRDRR